MLLEYYTEPFYQIIGSYFCVHTSTITLSTIDLEADQNLMHHAMNRMHLLLYFWRSLIQSHDMTDMNVLAGLPWWIPFLRQHPEQAPADRERCAASSLLRAREEAQASHRCQASTALSSLHDTSPIIFWLVRVRLILSLALIYVCSIDSEAITGWSPELPFCVSDVLFVRGGLEASDAVGWMDGSLEGTDS